MTAEYVLCFYQAMERLGVKVWIDGGWGVDALLERQTRPHGDLDIAIQQKDVSAFREFLEARGYRETKLDIARPHNFVMADHESHEIDVHVIVVDGEGNGIYGPPEKGEMYPAASLTGAGVINQYPVRCISAEWMVKFHTGYKLRESDFQDISALCQKFSIDPPSEYSVRRPRTGSSKLSNRYHDI